MAIPTTLATPDTPAMPGTPATPSTPTMLATRPGDQLELSFHSPFHLSSQHLCRAGGSSDLVLQELGQVVPKSLLQETTKTLSILVSAVRNRGGASWGVQAWVSQEVAITLAGASACGASRQGCPSPGCLREQDGHPPQTSR